MKRDGVLVSLSIYKLLLLSCMLLLLSFSLALSDNLKISFISNSQNETALLKKASVDTMYMNLLDNFDSDITFYENSILPQDSIFPGGFSVFRPELFITDVDTNISEIKLNRIITSNIKSGSDSLMSQVVTDTIIELYDSTKIGIFGIVTPDFPILFPKYSKKYMFRFDIFNCTDEKLREFILNDVEVIIAINYLDEYLNYQLLEKFPQIDYIFDFFEKGKDDYSKREILKEKLINLEFSDFLLKNYVFYYSYKPIFNIDSLKIHTRN